MYFVRLLASALTLAAAPAALAQTAAATQEVLTNDTILALTAAGLPDEVVVAKIKTSPSRFDTSTATILALKQKGLSGPVIAAMVAASGATATPSMSLDSPDPMVAHPSGVYVLSGEGAGAKMMPIQATVSNQAKTGGIFGYALTGGIASMSIKAAIPGSEAPVTTGANPVFYFFFDDSNPGSAMQSSTWLAGSASVVKSPAEFSLVALMEKKGRREARVGSANIAGAKTGVMDKDRIAFGYEMVRPGVYRVTPKAPLGKGQYGFLYSLAGAPGGAMTARVYDFGVK